jgi:hypothetical protein
MNILGALETTVPENLGDYEAMIIKLDPSLEMQISAVEIIKEFIIKHKLIVYGGTAIDFALRLKGSSIYSDSTLTVPDLDFYSPNNILDASTLADELYAAGFEEVRTFHGVHITTQRVDIIDNHCLADISYCPAVVFDIIPTLEYLGMRIVHPWYQLLDVHSALSFLYDEAPREVVFHRLNKDISRGGAALKYYPVEIPAGTIVARPEIKPRTLTGLKKYVLTGALAYGFYYRKYLDLGGDPSAPGIVPLDIQVNGTTVIAPVDTLEIVSIAPAKSAESLGLTKYTTYEPLFNLFPERIEGVLSGVLETNDEDPSTNVCIYSTKNKLLSITSIGTEEDHQRVVCVQYLLRHFMAKYIVTSDYSYLSYYISLMAMIPKDCSVIDTPFYISAEYYGTDNQSHSYHQRLMYIKKDIENGPLPVVPPKYQPARPRALVIPDNIPGFVCSGRVKTPESAH